MEASGWAYTEALSELYPTRADVAAEIAELEGRLTLPRSTELFASDIHGEYNAFSHVLRGGSGAVRALIEDVFGSTLNDDEKAALLALACYPAEHCAYALGHVEDADAWLAEAAARLAKIARSGRPATAPSTKCARFCLTTSPSLRSSSPAQHAGPTALSRGDHRKPRRPPARARPLLEVLGALIQHLVVDQLHLIGDVYDRGPAPQLIMDELLSYPNVDVQWGNHDILWMGARCRQPRQRGQRCAHLRPLRQPVHSGGRLRHQPAPLGHLRRRRLRERPLRRLCPEGQSGAFRGRDAPHREGPEGHGRYPVQGGGGTYRREPLVRPGRSQPSAPDRP